MITLYWKKTEARLMEHRMAKVVNVRNIITNGNIKNKYLCVHPDVNN